MLEEILAIYRKINHRDDTSVYSSYKIISAITNFAFVAEYEDKYVNFLLGVNEERLRFLYLYRNNALVRDNNIFKEFIPFIKDKFTDVPDITTESEEVLQQITNELRILENYYYSIDKVISPYTAENSYIYTNGNRTVFAALILAEKIYRDSQKPIEQRKYTNYMPYIRRYQETKLMLADFMADNNATQLDVIMLSNYFHFTPVTFRKGLNNTVTAYAIDASAANLDGIYSVINDLGVSLYCYQELDAGMQRDTFSCAYFAIMLSGKLFRATEEQLNLWLKNIPQNLPADIVKYSQSRKFIKNYIARNNQNTFKGQFNNSKTIDLAEVVQNNFRYRLINREILPHGERHFSQRPFTVSNANPIHSLRLKYANRVWAALANNKTSLLKAISNYNPYSIVNEIKSNKYSQEELSQALHVLFSKLKNPDILFVVNILLTEFTNYGADINYKFDENTLLSLLIKLNPGDVKNEEIAASPINLVRDVIYSLVNILLHKDIEVNAIIDGNKTVLDICRDPNIAKLLIQSGAKRFNNLSFNEYSRHL